MLSVLDKIPASLWVIIASIIGSLSALAGVLLTNRAQDRRFKAQLAHDLELKNREREMSWRKEVFLKAAEAITTAFISIGRFMNLEIAFDKLTEDYLDKTSSLTQINVVAREATVRVVGEFSSELGATFMRLMAKRFPLAMKSQKINFLRGAIDTAAKERSRILEMMRQYNIEGLSDAHKWQVLNRSFEFEKQRIDDASTKIGDLTVQLNAERIQFMEASTNEMISLSRLLVPVIVSVRKELDLSTDEDEFSRRLEESIIKQVNTMRAFIEEVRSLSSLD